MEKKEKKRGKEVAFPPFQGARRRYNEGQSIFVKERFRPISPSSAIRGVRRRRLRRSPAFPVFLVSGRAIRAYLRRLTWLNRVEVLKRRITANVRPTRKRAAPSVAWSRPDSDFDFGRKRVRATFATKREWRFLTLFALLPFTPASERVESGKIGKIEKRRKAARPFFPSS